MMLSKPFKSHVSLRGVAKTVTLTRPGSRAPELSLGRKFLGLVILMAVCVSGSLTANGQTIIEDDGFSLFAPSFSGGSITVFREAGDNTGLVFDISPPTSTDFSIAAVGVTLDISGGDWFIAQEGQVFSPGTIAAGQFDNISSTSNPFDLPSRQFFQETELSNFVDSPANVFGQTEATQFYIAVATTNGNDVPDGVFIGDPDFPPRDIFGWALIEVGASTFDDSLQSVEILDSAVAFGAGNIIVGQNASAVPEPSSGIALLALLGLGVARRRK